jgi:Flp pilus assembly CpaF family ATPase
LEREWERAHSGARTAPDIHDEDRIIDEVIGSLLSILPGLDVHLARDDVIEVFVVGSDQVCVRFVDGHEEWAAPIAFSDEALIEQLQALARKGGQLSLTDADEIELEFSRSRPLLELDLSDGRSRLSAGAWIADRPYVTVCRHPRVDADQSTLVGYGMYDEHVASVLGAAVRAGLNIVVAGGPGHGKTTLVRALLHELRSPPPGYPVGERPPRILVLEDQRELHLAADPGHRHVVELRTRAANMEGYGAVTLADLVHHARRQRPDILVIGEVRGSEVMFMLEAALDGVAGGTLSTLHARSAREVFDKIVLLAQRDGAAFETSRVLKTAARALDLVVYLDRTPAGRRVVSEISQVVGFDHSTNQVITNDWWVAGPDKAAIPNPSFPNSPIPSDARELLVAHGYEPDLALDLAW